MFSHTTLPLSALLAPLSPRTLRPIALAIRATVTRYRSPTLLRAATNWIASCPRGGVGSVDMNVDVVLGLDVIATSWRVLRAYERGDFGFGPLRALRWASAVFDGYCFFYPGRRPGGEAGGEDEGVEVYLGLERGCMERLRGDGELGAWAEVRGG
ncbi:hypothetical protein BK809_0001959 [Diplodia seriata]|uniref:Uncharacterized protein n=1 Tax=Diplodia seriata TaxID=420778 RepID=A0A1S8BBL3_9PEZI|nr:hypothetical protein BK809_0001959 [Diplodia seriata]